MTGPKIKFCGLTRAEDIALAGELGVDYVGLVLAGGSPRRLGIARAAGLARQLRGLELPPRLVLLVRDQPVAEIEDLIATLAPDLLQFHGSEGEHDCRRFGLPYWKAIGMADGIDEQQLADSHRGAEALLLDAHAPGAAGGSGQRFDWSSWPKLHRALVLAGGLDPDNVAAAIAQTRPYAVDVSSGIESAPGRKDPARMHAFVAAVRGV